MQYYGEELTGAFSILQWFINQQIHSGMMSIRENASELYLGYLNVSDGTSVLEAINQEFFWSVAPSSTPGYFQ